MQIQSRKKDLLYHNVKQIIIDYYNNHNIRQNSLIYYNIKQLQDKIYKKHSKNIQQY